MADYNKVYDSNNYLNCYGESYSEVYGSDPEEDSYLDYYPSGTESEDDCDPDVFALQEDTNSFYHLQTSKSREASIVLWPFDWPTTLTPRNLCSH